MSRGYNSGGRGLTSSGRGFDVGSVYPVTIDDFERTSPIDEYTETSTTGGYYRDNDNPANGSHHLESNTSDDNSRIFSSSGLNHYPARGEYIKVFGQVGANFSDRWFFWFAGPETVKADGANGADSYRLRVNFNSSSNNFAIRKYESGIGSVDLAEGSFSRGSSGIGTDLFEAHIDFGASTASDLSATLYNDTGGSEASIGPATDSTHDGGDEIAWLLDDNGGSTVRADYAHVNNTDQTTVLADGGTRRHMTALVPRTGSGTEEDPIRPAHVDLLTDVGRWHIDWDHSASHKLFVTLIDDPSTIASIRSSIAPRRDTTVIDVADRNRPTRIPDILRPKGWL